MNNWEGINELKKVPYEVISTANPISFDLSFAGSNIQSLEVQTFYYDQGVSSGGVQYLGIVGQGCNNQCNEYNKKTNVILSLPARSGKFDYLAQDGNFDGYLYNKGTNLELGFVVRDSGSGTSTAVDTPMVFNSPYLLRIIFEVSN